MASGLTYPYTSTTTDFTFMFWAKDVATMVGTILLIKNSVPTTLLKIDIEPDGAGNTEIFVNSTGSGSLTGFDLGTSSFQHVALVYEHSTTTVTIYGDGVSIGSINISSSVSSPATLQYGDDQNWEGFDARFYSKQITEAALSFYVDDVNTDSGNGVLPYA